MRMIKVKHGKDMHLYRLDWLVLWQLFHTQQNDKNPEECEIVLLFAEPGYYKLNKTGNNGRINREVRFEFDTKAEAIAAVLIVDI